MDIVAITVVFHNAHYLVRMVMTGLTRLTMKQKNDLATAWHRSCTALRSPYSPPSQTSTVDG